MIAAISLMRRRDDVSLPAFRRHWLDVHGPLVCGFPGLRHYVQCHVLESPATNAMARAMRIDGFPMLVFDTDADRVRAHGSPEMAACNVDSRLFIGAVARIIAEQTDVVPIMPAAAGRMRLIVVHLQGTGEAVIDRDLQRLRVLPRLCGLRRYRVLEQGRSPNSVIPHLQVPAAGLAEAWFESLVDLECAVAGAATLEAATFAVEEHRLA